MGFLKRFSRAEGGNLAVTFAVSAIPIMIIGTAALDMTYAERIDNNLQNALDTAALAAVSNPNLSMAKREAYAAQVFNDNFNSKLKPVLKFPRSGTSNIFSITGELEIPSTLGSLVNLDTFSIDAESAAVLDNEGSICVLALAPDGPDRLYFQDRISFNAPNCAIHANSSSPNAINNNGNGIPAAGSFCAVGSGVGDFKPAINSECSKIADPYAALDFPAMSETCKGGGEKIKKNGKNGVDQARLTPGLFCKGLTVSGTNVDFAPGTYIIQDGPLWFRKGSNSTAYGVTFIMLGKKASLKVDHGAELYVRAPKKGPYAGLAFAQQTPADTVEFPTNSSKISSAGLLDIEGTLYFPSQSLEVNSESRFGSRSKATSFIAYEMSFTGDSVATVSMDYRAAGLPPLEPRSTGGPRLIK